jgi:DNA-binding GntR family transcriptional regulator
MKKRARFYYSTVASQLGRDWVDVHEQLVQLIADREADAAAACLRRHIEDTGLAVRELLLRHGI